ncbi:MAG TPA: hypothetical protein VIM46_01200 [Luteolibacter sp.]|jgi:hypothetical protein
MKRIARCLLLASCALCALSLASCGLANGLYDTADHLVQAASRSVGGGN